MKEKILYKAIVGSKLYGTDSINSDTDIKGIFLPDINDLILNKAPKHFVSSSKICKNDKNNKNDIDETYYSIQYFLELLAIGETNVMDLFFSFTNKNCILYVSDEWKNNFNEILNHCISKNVNKYMSYCKSQCQKYSIKGDKLNNYNQFLKMCEFYFNNKDKNGAPITLAEALCQAFHYDSLKHLIPKVGEDRIKVTFSNFTPYKFGDHCYFITADNKESYISISDMKFTLSDSIKSAYHKCKKVINSYGKRAQAAADNDGSDLKAISHCVRVLCQVEEILETGKITFPLKDADFIKSIKYNTSHLTRDEIMNWIEKKIEIINDKIEKSTLRTKADYKWINNFIISCYNV